VILPILAEGITAGRSVSAGGDGMAVGALEFAQGPSDVARVDFVLARPLWGKGLMTEAVAEVIGWAFHALPELSSILSGGLVAIIGSIRVMQKCGLTLQTNEYLAFAKFGGTIHEVLHYRIEREAWARLHP